jgi:hypothetical protein
MDVKAELRKQAVGRDFYEIMSANLVYAEFISPQWRRAWNALDAGLREIVAISRTAPGDRKARRLAEAIELSSRSEKGDSHQI